MISYHLPYDIISHLTFSLPSQTLQPLREVLGSHWNRPDKSTTVTIATCFCGRPYSYQRPEKHLSRVCPRSTNPSNGVTVQEAYMALGSGIDDRGGDKGIRHHISPFLSLRFLPPPAGKAQGRDIHTTISIRYHLFTRLSYLPWVYLVADGKRGERGVCFFFSSCFFFFSFFIISACHLLYP